MRVLIYLASLIALIWSVTSNAELYVAAGNGSDTNLYIVSQTDGSIVKTVGDTGYLLTGLAFSPLSGELYGTTSGYAPNALVKIDPDTGAATEVGPHNGPIVDISFAPDGTLYGWSEYEDALVTIDLTTGETTQIGPTYSTGQAAMDFSPDGRLWRFGRYTGSGAYCSVTAWRTDGTYVIDVVTTDSCPAIPGGTHLPRRVALCHLRSKQEPR